MGNHKDFYERVQNWIDEESIVHEGLAHEGPILIEKLTRKMSLRNLAAKSGYSPTYLSQVKNGQAVISPRAFLELSTLAMVHSQLFGNSE